MPVQERRAGYPTPAFARHLQRPDYLVVGTGLTGAVAARMLTDAGKSVLCVERRMNVGGNVHDAVHPSGIRVQTFGPHYFRTSSRRIWSFVRRFGEFYRYEAVVRARINGVEEGWPVSESLVRRYGGAGWRPPGGGPPTNFEEAVLRLMPPRAYALFVKEYTEKQWGVAPATLSAQLARRIQVRSDEDPRLTPRARYQFLPVNGYTALVESMLEGIPVVRGFDFLTDRELFRPKRSTIFTGPIDAFFDYALGRLAYRGQRRSTTHIEGERWLQSVAQVNEPLHAGGPHIRTIEWKRLLPPDAARAFAGTVVTEEVPVTAASIGECEYPFPDRANAELYARYRALASERRDVLICGRLGEYRYLDMDQAIGRVMAHLRRMHARNAADARSHPS